MAGSRLQSFDTIFSRVQGLIKAKALKFEERPIWYDIYAAFPPRDAPSMSREKPCQDVTNILYPEDLIRAKFYRKYGNLGHIDMNNEQYKSICHKFVEKYFELQHIESKKSEKMSTYDLFEATEIALDMRKETESDDSGWQ